jgi:4-carboxymuconolactone decarboxylase
VLQFEFGAARRRYTRRLETGEETQMADDDRYQRGVEMIKKVYAGDVIVPPKGAMAFSDLMLESLFAEVWTREELSIRDRRLILFGAIGAIGEKDTFAIQAKAALKNEELTPEQLREIIITLANYAGYPRAAGLIGVAENAIAAVAKEQASGD